MLHSGLERSSRGVGSPAHPKRFFDESAMVEYCGKTMQNPIVYIAVIIAILLAGCGDADMKKTPDEIRASAAAMSTADIQTKLKEIEKRSEEVTKRTRDNATESETAEMTKLMEIANIYTAELVKRKAK
jgi:hypothetical protein